MPSTIVQFYQIFKSATADHKKYAGLLIAIMVWWWAYYGLVLGSLFVNNEAKKATKSLGCVKGDVTWLGWPCLYPKEQIISPTACMTENELISSCFPKLSVPSKSVLCQSDYYRDLSLTRSSWWRHFWSGCEHCLWVPASEFWVRLLK